MYEGIVMVAEPARLDYLELVRDALAHALDLDRDTTDMGLEVLLTGMPNMSSLAMLRGMMFIESKLRIELEDDQLVDARTIGDLAKMIERQHVEAAA